MAATGPVPGDVPSGATMQPRYMGRIMNTYPVSEAELEQVSSLSGQATARFSLATFLVGIGVSPWINAMFYTELTPEAKIATKFVAPLLVGFGVVSALAGCWAQYKRLNAWAKIKAESKPIQAIATTAEMVGIAHGTSSAVAVGAVGQSLSRMSG
jgi:hypothetical protein